MTLDNENPLPEGGGGGIQVIQQENFLCDAVNNRMTLEWQKDNVMC